jgi:hypothetical protein
MSGDAGRDLSILKSGGGLGLGGIGADEVGVSLIAVDPEFVASGESWRSPSISISESGSVTIEEESDPLEGGGLDWVEEGSL